MTLNLTEYEKRMLDGTEGKLKQKAMEVIVRYANVMNAEELCTVTKAHLHCGYHTYLRTVKSGNVDEIISEMFFCSDETLTFQEVCCDCFADVGPMCPDNWKEMGVTSEEFELNQKFLERSLDAGVKLYGTCVPYLVGFIPLMGEHYVTSESHVVLLANSLWGACGNSDGLETGFCSAVCGRTPLWGNHIMSNRGGTHLIQLNNMTGKTLTVYDWDILGYTVGRKLAPHIKPVIAGGFSRPDIYKLKAFFASLATTSGPEICHITGITPEAVTIDQAFKGEKPLAIIEIDERNLSETRQLFSQDGDVDYVSLGCPHYSLEEIRQTAALLEGKRVSRNVRLHIWTAYAFKAVADRCGYTDIIEKAGGKLMTGSCPASVEVLPPGFDLVAFDSTKMAHDYLSMPHSKVYHGSMEQCIRSAVSGRWEGN
jgi:cis-L-3-hydroxyproline dehydratase